MHASIEKFKIGIEIEFSDMKVIEITRIIETSLFININFCQKD
jgi:hypothetical protein